MEQRSQYSLLNDVPRYFMSSELDPAARFKWAMTVYLTH